MALYNTSGNYGAPRTPTATFGNPYSPPSVRRNPVRNMDFYNKKNPGGQPVTPSAPYQPYIKTAADRSTTMWNEARAGQPQLDWAPESWDAYQTMAGGDYPQLRDYGNFPNASAAKQWMAELEGGQRNALDEYVRRTAGAGISRGGLASAGGPARDSMLRNQEMAQLASLFGSNFREGMGYAEKGADWDRTKARDEFAAQEAAARAKQQALAQFLAAKQAQSGQQLQKYGTDLSGSLALGNQGLAATQAGTNNALDQLRMQESAWDKDVASDRALMDRNPWYETPTVAARDQLTGVSPNKGASPAPAIDQIVIRNMDEGRGAQKNAAGQAAAQEYDKQRQINDYLKKYRSSAIRQAPDYNQGFNYTPEDLRMAALMGIQLPDQGRVQYQMQSQTRGGR